MYCTKCGTEISADAKYCPNCGNAITNEIDSEQIERIDEKSYRKMYMYYGICAAALLWGFFYTNFIRITDTYGGYGIERVIEKTFGQQFGFSALIAIYCLYGIVKGKIKFSMWKIGRIILSMLISVAGSFALLFYVAINTPQMTDIEAFEWMSKTVPVVIVVLIVILSVLIINSCLLKSRRSVDIYKNRDYEVVSAILASDIWVTIVIIIMFIAISK